MFKYIKRCRELEEENRQLKNRLEKALMENVNSRMRVSVCEKSLDKYKQLYLEEVEKRLMLAESVSKSGIIAVDIRGDAE